MKKILFAMVLMAAAYMPVNAQTVEPAKTQKSASDIKAEREAKFQNAIKAAGIEADKADKVKIIQTDIANKLKELKRSGAGGDDLKAKTKVIRNEEKEKLVALLGEAQYQKFTTEIRKKSE